MAKLFPKRKPEIEPNIMFLFDLVTEDPMEFGALYAGNITIIMPKDTDPDVIIQHIIQNGFFNKITKWWVAPAMIRQIKFIETREIENAI